VKISTKSRYAIKLMLDIAANEHNGNVSIKDVSERSDISVKYLEQIVSSLCRCGFVKSRRGSQGGYQLTKKADQYTIGNIIRAMEGEISDDYIDESDAELRNFWHGLYDEINRYIDSVTIGDIIEKSKTDNQIFDYYI
jgi:Rrf2 family protein